MMNTMTNAINSLVKKNFFFPMSSSKTNISLVGKTFFYIVFKRYNITA